MVASSPNGPSPVKSTLGLENLPPQRSQVFGAFALSIALVAAAALAAVFGQGRGPTLYVFFAIAATVWALADLLTAFLLLSQFYVNGSFLFGMLAVAYGFSGLLTWPYLAAFPGLFGTSLETIGQQQISITLWAIWHSTFPILVAGAIVYDSAFGRTVTRRNIRRATGIFVALPLAMAVGVTALTFAFCDKLPQLVSNGHFTYVYRLVYMPTMVFLSIIACIAVLATHRRRTALSLWLVVAMLTVALDAMLNMSAARFSYAWDVGKIITVVTSSVVLATILADIAGLYGRLASVARVDVLTSLPNRRAFEEHFEVVLQEARRTAGSMAVLIVDVDHFKHYNDTFGHLAGDECLRSVAMEMLGCATRPLDVVARYGGEEFVVVLPQTDLDGVRATAERMRASVERLAITHHGKATRGVTVSIGTSYVSDATGIDEVAFLEAADRALYAAKSTGRNRVVLGALDAIDARPPQAIEAQAEAHVI